MDKEILDEIKRRQPLTLVYKELKNNHTHTHIKIHPRATTQFEEDKFVKEIFEIFMNANKSLEVIEKSLEEKEKRKGRMIRI